MVNEITVTMKSDLRPNTKAIGTSAYRPEIDGLRALAILVVVGFHAFPTVVPSGFVGVDVFFVISGYLISTIILNESIAAISASSISTCAASGAFFPR